MTFLKINGRVKMLSKDHNIPVLSTIVERIKSGFKKYAIRKRGVDNDYFIQTRFTLKAMSDFSISMLADLTVKKMISEAFIKENDMPFGPLTRTRSKNIAKTSNV